MENNISPVNQIDKTDGIVTEKVTKGKKNIKLKHIIRYSQLGLSCREIGLILKCSKQSISKRLIEWEKRKENNSKIATSNCLKRTIDR